MTRLEAVVAELSDVVGRLEPERLRGDDAARLVDAFARGERLCGAGRALAARRVAESGTWKSSGERSAAHWLARRSGTSVGSAASALETAARVESLPALDTAYRAGELSGAQAAEVASAAAASPSSEADLLHLARSDALAGLSQQCRRVVGAAAGAEERARQAAVHRRRWLRDWCDEGGTSRVDAGMAGEDLGRLKAALAPFEAKAFEQARREGRREAYAAYRLDALLLMAEAAGAPGSHETHSAPRSTAVVLVSSAALVRGRAEAGERCEIDGVGPVPVATARSMMADAFVTAVQTDGVEVNKVLHLGRRPTAAQRAALVVRDPECVVPGCHVREHLEIDHVDPWALTRVTRIDRLARLCRFHHGKKTYEGWWLEGGPGGWRWLAPEGDGEAERAPP